MVSVDLPQRKGMIQNLEANISLPVSTELHCLFFFFCFFLGGGGGVRGRGVMDLGHAIKEVTTYPHPLFLLLYHFTPLQGVLTPFAKYFM